VGRIGALATALTMPLLAPQLALALGGQSSSGNAAAAEYTHHAVASSQLPFTGYLLIALVPTALLLLSLGLFIRRLSGRGSTG